MNCEDFSKLPIYLIGAGNVASHLGIALTGMGIKIKSVWSRNIENATVLSKNINSGFTDNLNEICNEKAIYIISVPDIAISEIIKTIGKNNSVLIHTSGSTNINVFESYSTNYGVFYPLQTFSKTKKDLNFSEIPVFFESSNNCVNEILDNWCKLLNVKAINLNSEQRLKIHIAAVFANNFTNHMMTIAQELTTEYNIDFNLLRPLITETFEKLKSFNPNEIQTGPAIRNDITTINKHLNSLSDNPDFAKIYSFVSESILKMYKEQK
ncbi:MAG: DUF2520 domain-containing protein [Bacteroidia bacterium]|nr:DUF2520 domain-containing protein [Bacteroidia bacterium]